jgi:hypothetical protein
MSAPTGNGSVNRDDTASTAAVLVFALLGLTGLAGTPRVGTDHMFPVLVSAHQEVISCPLFQCFHR